MEKDKEKKIIEMTDHLLYEVQMLINSSLALASLKINENNGPLLITIRNALVESFAIHARILLDFLYSKREKETDMIADDFFDELDKWRKVRPKKTPLLKIIHRRVGKEIVHLSYNRLKDETGNRKWSIQIAKDIVAVLDKFVCVVPSNRIGNKFSKYINYLSKSDVWTGI